MVEEEKKKATEKSFTKKKEGLYNLVICVEKHMFYKKKLLEDHAVSKQFKGKLPRLTEKRFLGPKPFFTLLQGEFFYEHSSALSSST